MRTGNVSEDTSVQIAWIPENLDEFPRVKANILLNAALASQYDFCIPVLSLQETSALITHKIFQGIKVNKWKAYKGVA